MPRAQCKILPFGLLAGTLLAQLPSSGWLTGGGQGWALWLSEGFAPLSLPNNFGQGPSSGGSIAVDERRIAYIMDGIGSIYRVLYDGQLPSTNQLVVETPGYYLGVGTPALQHQLFVTRERLWYVERNGALYSVGKDLTGGPPVIEGNIWGQPLATSGAIQSACTDGRDIFYSIGSIPFSPVLSHSEIWAADLRAPGSSRRLIATIPVDRWTQLACGPNGDLMAMRYDGLYRIVPTTGSVSVVASRPSFIVSPNPSVPYNVLYLGYDPWTAMIAIGPACWWTLLISPQ